MRSDEQVIKDDWSAALGACPASPDWKSGAAMSLLAAHLDKVLRSAAGVQQVHHPVAAGI